MNETNKSKKFIILIIAIIIVVLILAILFLFKDKISFLGGNTTTTTITTTEETKHTRTKKTTTSINDLPLFSDDVPTTAISEAKNYEYEELDEIKGNKKYESISFKSELTYSGNTTTIKHYNIDDNSKVTLAKTITVKNITKIRGYEDKDCNYSVDLFFITSDGIYYYAASSNAAFEDENATYEYTKLSSKKYVDVVGHSYKTICGTSKNYYLKDSNNKYYTLYEVKAYDTSFKYLYAAGIYLIADNYYLYKETDKQDIQVKAIITRNKSETISYILSADNYLYTVNGSKLTKSSNKVVNFSIIAMTSTTKQTSSTKKVTTTRTSSTTTTTTKEPEKKIQVTFDNGKTQLIDNKFKITTF